MVHAVTPDKRGWPRMPFVAIIEAYVLRSLRDMGVSMEEIRRAADVVRLEFRDDYALASQPIATMVSRCSWSWRTDPLSSSRTTSRGFVRCSTTISPMTTPGTTA